MYSALYFRQARHYKNHLIIIKRLLFILSVSDPPPGDGPSLLERSVRQLPRAPCRIVQSDTMDLKTTREIKGEIEFLHYFRDGGCLVKSDIRNRSISFRRTERNWKSIGSREVFFDSDVN